MKRVILGFVAAACVGAVPAIAADLGRMPVKAPVSAPAIAVYNWSGFYFGVHGGYGSGEVENTNINGNPPFPAGEVNSSDVKGWLAGGQVGFNYQFTPNWLLGIEGDFSWSGIDSSSGTFSTVGGFTTNRFQTTELDVKWLATVTGRLGLTFNNWLLYAKGGVAWTKTEGSSVTVNPAAANLLLGTASGSETRTGWVAGAGAEVGFWNNWSFKAEYNYLDFGTEQVSRAVTYYNGASGINPALRDSDLHIHVVKFGFNWRFGGVGASY
jgi:outer membrane immunogenic protein